MRVLILESHPLWIYGLPNGFRDAGHNVLVSGPLTSDNIPQMLNDFSPHLIVSMGWTPEHSAEKENWIFEYVKPTGIPLIYWATEDPAHTQSHMLPSIQRMQPDFVFTICPAMVREYLAMGIPAAHLDFGYHHSIHCPVDPVPEYRCSIAVVANVYPTLLDDVDLRLKSIKTLILPLIQENIRVDFWGEHWEMIASDLSIHIPQEWLHGSLPYTEANRVYSSADIVIGLQNYPEQVTMRTYEILASGGMLITLDTPAIRRAFVPYRELEVSAWPLETLHLVRLYSEHAERRNRVRSQALLAVAEHSYLHWAKYIVHTLQNNGFLHYLSS